MRGPLVPLLTHQGCQAPMIFCSETPFTICHTVVVQQVILSAIFYSHTINTWWKLPSHTHTCADSKPTTGPPTRTATHKANSPTQALQSRIGKPPSPWRVTSEPFLQLPRGPRCLAQLRVPTAIAPTTAWYRLYRVTNWFCMNHFIWFKFYNNSQDRYYLPPFYRWVYWVQNTQFAQGHTPREQQSWDSIQCPMAYGAWS